MNLFHDIPSGNADFSQINVLLEIPKNSYVKYEYNHELGALFVDRLLKTPIPYNFNYGDIPQCWNVGDNDPLDAIVLSRASFTPGTIVPCRVIGGLKVIDQGEDDYKVIAVADDVYYAHVHSVEDINPAEKQDIEYFALHYKDLEKKKVEVHGWDSKELAQKRI